jgi:putative acetyltransferase
LKLVVGLPTITVRIAGPDDAEAIASIHYDAVHATAAADYPPAVIAQWARPIDAERIAEFRRSHEDEIRVVAEMDGVMIGFGAVVLDRNELRACYVSPRGGTSRRGPHDRA